MSCGLSIIGKNLDIDTLVDQMDVAGFSKSYKGESISNVNPKKRQYSFVSIITSRASFENLPKQIEETIAFLKENRQNLKYISKTPEVDFATVNFGIDSLISDNRLSQSIYFPIELIEICAKLGISIETTIYKKDMEDILEKQRITDMKS